MSLQPNKLLLLGALFLTAFTISGRLFAQEGDFYTDQETQDNVSPSEWTPPQEGGMVMPSQDNGAKVTPHSSSSKDDTKLKEVKPDKSVVEKSQSQKTTIDNRQSNSEDDFDSLEKDEDSVMSFNFLYYLIHKFKFSESIQ